MKYYAVRRGRQPGIYTDWNICKREVTGFKGAEYKSFKTFEEAKDYYNFEKVEPKEFDIIPKGYCKAYVDGSYDVKTGSYGYGIVFFSMNEEEHLFGKDDDPEYSSMRNVAGEILGSMKAVTLAKERNMKEIHIYYDYMGIEKWVTGEWKANKKGTIYYRDFMQDAKNDINILFKKVEAHTGNKYNELADFLAKKSLGIKQN